MSQKLHTRSDKVALPRREEEEREGRGQGCLIWEDKGFRRVKRQVGELGYLTENFSGKLVKVCRRECGCRLVSHAMLAFYSVSSISRAILSPSVPA